MYDEYGYTDMYSAGFHHFDTLEEKCPICGKPMATNLRCDDTFVEDEGWHKAKNRYIDFIKKNKDKKILYLELGVGYSTPI